MTSSRWGHGYCDAIASTDFRSGSQILGLHERNLFLG